tara:strand:- start:924 stop:1349 length:426 start_codon:yes stop_codon:yes gene_type:complete
MVKRIVAKTQNDGWKPRKKRKPMTEEQRKAAAERLALARAKKAPSENTSIHPSVLALPDDHCLSAKKVKEWIRSNRQMMSSYRTQMRKDVKGARARYYDLEGYIRFMKHYLKHGDWISDVYGEHQEKRTKWRVVASPTILS